MAQPHCVVYEGHTERVTDHDPKTALAQARAAGAMLWVSLSQPTNDEVRSLAAIFDLELLGVESALRTHQRSKLDHYGDHLFVVIQPAQYNDAADGVEHDIDQIEEELFADGAHVSHRIFALQREVIDLGHATAPLEDMLSRLQRIVEKRLHVTDAPAFHEIADRARYIDGRVSAFRSTLDNALSIHATIVDQRRNEAMRRMTEQSIQQNDQVKKISSWAAIGFAPTLVAGIYGMNFTFMPELAWPWGYPMALGLMVAVSAGLYGVFKKNDWL